MDKLIDFLYKEYFITDSIKFSIVTILFVTMIFLITYFLLKIIKKIATKKLDEERKLKFKSVFSFFNYFVYVVIALMTFQNFLTRVPKWNSNIIDEEAKRINTKSECPYLSDLLKLKKFNRKGREQKVLFPFFLPKSTVIRNFFKKVNI